MARASSWFPTQLDGDGFSLVLIRPDLEIPFEVFIRFRDDVWADAALKRDSRIYDSGLQSEVGRSQERSCWEHLQPGGDENGGRYIVRSASGDIVGLLRVVRNGDNAIYANVLYRRRTSDRSSVSPDAALRRLLGWLRDAGIREVTTGKVDGPKFPNHVKRCGFTNETGAWRLRLSDR
ncbi:MAG: hypothetical protein AB7T06_26220 [Kofleriaceae bacterium]